MGWGRCQAERPPNASESISAYVIAPQPWPWHHHCSEQGRCIYSNSLSFIFQKDLFLSPIYFSKESCFSGSFPLAALVGDLSKHFCLAANLFSWQYPRDNLPGKNWRISGNNNFLFFVSTASQPLTTFLKILNKEKQFHGHLSLYFFFPFQCLRTILCQI